MWQSRCLLSKAPWLQTVPWSRKSFQRRNSCNLSILCLIGKCQNYSLCSSTLQLQNKIPLRSLNTRLMKQQRKYLPSKLP